jgi:hypothetical protein
MPICVFSIYGKNALDVFSLNVYILSEYSPCMLKYLWAFEDEFAYI